MVAEVEISLSLSLAPQLQKNFSSSARPPFLARLPRIHARQPLPCDPSSRPAVRADARGRGLPARCASFSLSLFTFRDVGRATRSPYSPDPPGPAASSRARASRCSMS
jgi:hypothetical protein